MQKGDKFEYDDPMGILDPVDEEKRPAATGYEPGMDSALSDIKQEEDFLKHCRELQAARLFLTKKGLSQKTITDELWKRLKFK